MPTALVTWQECQEGTSGSHLSPLSAAMGVIFSMLVRSVDKLLGLPLQPQPSHPRHSVMLPQRCQQGLLQGASRAASQLPE